MIDSTLTKQADPKAAAESARAGFETIGSMLVVVALALLAGDAIQRGWLSGLEGVGLFLLIRGLWMAIRHRKVG